MIVKPFRGLRPRSDLAAGIPSAPYDVVTTEEARERVRRNPRSFLRVVRPEVDLDPGTDPHDERVYRTGRDNFRALIDAGDLVRDAVPAYYAYRLRGAGHTQTGIFGAVALEDYLEGRIKRHEHTRPDKELDRARLIDALSAHPGPVFLAHRRDPRLAEEIAAATASSPATSHTDENGVEHQVWVVDEAERRERIERLFRDVPASYIADGHHRAAAAARVCAERSARLEAAGGAAPWRFFLAAHFPGDELRILEYNRVVRDLAGRTPAEFLDELRARGFELKADRAARRPPRRGSFGMYLDRRWYLLVPTERPRPGDVAAGLDVAVLAATLLAPVLGIDDPRSSQRIDFVGGARGPEELERRVDSGAWAVAFALHPTSLGDVMRVADTGGVMPPKSTWFEPKLRSGLVVQLLDGKEL